MQEINKIPLEGVFNTRDLGGFITADGRAVKPHRLIRSGELFTLTEGDKKILVDEYELKTIVDFRTMQEIKDKPDPELEGVTAIHNPILNEASMGITREEKQKLDLIEMLAKMLEKGISGEKYLADLYTTIAIKNFSKAQYKNFFEILLNQETGAVLWHCSAGKDRVGTGTALLLTALGVPRDIIIQDYLMTNIFGQHTLEQVVKEVSAKYDNPEIIDSVRAMFGVRESYILSVFNAIDERYGSIDNYLRDEMGLNDEKLAKLRDMYLQ